MKIVGVSSTLLSALFIASINGDEHMFDVLPRIAERCNVNKEAVNEYVHMMEEDYPFSEDAKCLLSCFHKIYRIKGNDGKFTPETSVDSVKGIIDPDTREKMTTMVVRCDKELKDDPRDDCTTSLLYARCCFKVSVEIGLPYERYMVTNLNELI